MSFDRYRHVTDTRTDRQRQNYGSRYAL